jgi:hypothetical protein
MAGNFKENGSTIIWMAWEFIHGQTEGAIWESIKTIKNMVMEYINGPTADYI